MNKLQALLIQAATNSLHGVSYEECAIIAHEIVEIMLQGYGYPEGVFMDWLCESDRLSLFLDTYTDENGVEYSPEQQWKEGMVTWVW